MNNGELAAPTAYQLLDEAVIENPYPFYAALLREAPVYRVPATDVYLVSSWALIHKVLREHQTYSANLTGILIRGQSGGPEVFDLTQFGGTVDALANADEPFHSVHRKLVLPQLNARKVESLEGEVRSWAQDAVERLLHTLGGDCISALANPIPVKVMARLAGLPVEDVDLLLQWAFSGGDLLAGTADLERMAALGASTSELAVYLREHFLAAQAAMPEEPQNLLHELVRGVREGKISEQDAIGILVVLVGAAGESTSSLVASAIRLLAEDSGLQQVLREEPHLIDTFVEEVVRLESPFKGHYRVVLKDAELGGIKLAAGSRLFLLWAAANRDPGVFAAPDVLDLQRTDGTEHLGFGHGIHFCIGARVARMEARVILQELLQRAEFTLQPHHIPRHVPSIFVRRLAHLQLQMKSLPGPVSIN